MASCQKAPTIIDESSPDYKGTMTVLYQGEDFVQDGVTVSVEMTEDRSMMDIKLHKVKFVPAMPISIDVTIMQVPVIEGQDGSLSFHADGIVPWAMGGPYKTYRVEDLEGYVDDDEISFSLGFYNTKKSANYPTTYSGVLK